MVGARPCGKKDGYTRGTTSVAGAPRMKTWCEKVDLSAGFERQLGQYFMDRSVRVLSPNVLRSGKIIRRVAG